MSESTPTSPEPATPAALSEPPESPAGPQVTAIVVTRGLTRYLPQTLAALSAQTRLPSRIVVVDADDDAPRPGVGAAARAAFGALGAELRIAPVPGAHTFGDAVRGALAVPSAGSEDAPGQDDWLWLLHDDSAPDPTALAELLRAVEHSSSVAIAGVKQRSWSEPSRLLEVGVTTSRLGRRMTGIDEGEVDQGQHDGRVDVLAVGLAGALVRRDVWDDLRGTDPMLGPFRDGIDLCRRARLAGHRVVVVPAASVRHAQASYRGLRRFDAVPFPDADPESTVDAESTSDADPDSAADSAAGDPRRSFGARRRAQVHSRLTTAPAALLPFLGIGFLLAGILRALVRVASKEPSLAVAELAAPVAALLHPGRMARSRAIIRRVSRLPRRSLRPLQASVRDVFREQRDDHFLRAERRRTGQAPSELELAELAALATRRRLGFGALAVALLALTALLLGPLVTGVLGGGALVGGALAPATAGLGELWRAATSGWIAADLGARGPADPLLTALLPFAAVTGGGAGGAVALLYLGALPLAGVGAWFAAGAATRSVGVRLWAAAVWVAAPGLGLAVDGGRLGAVIAHVALPWVALGVARAVGAQRYDVVLSGLIGARRVPGKARKPERALRRRFGRKPVAPPEAWFDGEREVWPDSEADARAAEEAEFAAASAAARAERTGGGSLSEPSQPGSSQFGSSQPGSDQFGSDQFSGDGGLNPRPTASIGAAAAAGLAFAIGTAGAPVLLPFGLLALLAVAAASPRRRRRRLALVALPALALFGPTFVEAVSGAGRGGWRLLLADPGLPVASTAAPVWQQLLAWPIQPAATAFGGLPVAVPAAVAGALPFVLGVVVGLLALLALVRGSAVARGVRVGWFVAACGLLAAFASARVETAAGSSVFVRGWPGAGVSLLLLGLLTAAVLGTDRLRARMGGYAFGWRQVGVVAVAVVAALAPLAPLTDWVVRSQDAGDPGALAVAPADGSVVSAVGQQSQTSPDRSRVLALGADPAGGVAYQLLTSDGPQLTDLSAAVDARALSGPPGAPVAAREDAAAREVADVVGMLSAAAANASAGLSDLAVATVLVPPATDESVAPARSVLVGRLDSTPGLERITENETGVLWRVVVAAEEAEADSAGAEDPPADGAAVSAAPAAASWARLVTPGADGDSSADGELVESVDARRLAVDTRVAPGDAARLLVLAERSDPGWRAWLDGKPLDAVSSDWRQGFDLGADGGRLTVAYAPPDRMPWLVVQGLVGLLTALLALPVRRRRGGIR